MIELRQADYNPDELAWEVIVAVTDLLKGGATKWGPEYDQLLESDRALFERVTNGDDSNATLDRWRGAEDEWKDMGTQFGIEVFDDGEGGYTYVGTSEEMSNIYYGANEENV